MPKVIKMSLEKQPEKAPLPTIAQTFEPLTAARIQREGQEETFRRQRVQEIVDDLPTLAPNPGHKSVHRVGHDREDRVFDVSVGRLEVKDEGEQYPAPGFFVAVEEVKQTPLREATSLDAVNLPGVYRFAWEGEEGYQATKLDAQALSRGEDPYRTEASPGQVTELGMLVGTAHFQQDMLTYASAEQHANNLNALAEVAGRLSLVPTAELGKA